MKKLLKSLMFSAVLLGAALPATAATIVDTGTGFNQSCEFDQIETLAGRFELTTPQILNSVEAFIDIWRDGPASVEIRQADGDLPGAVIYSQSFEVWTTPYAAWIGLGGLNWTLGAGTYWVSIVAEDPWAYGFWNTGVPNPLGKYAYYFNDHWEDLSRWPGSSDTLGYRIDGTPVNAPPAVPLPAGGLLLIWGLGLLALRRKFG